MLGGSMAALFKKKWVLFADLAIDYGFTAYRGCGRWVYCASYD